MKKTPFQSLLARIDVRIHLLRIRSNQAREQYGSGDLNRAYESALRLEETAEQLVLLSRALPVHTGNPGAIAATEAIMQSQIPVEIGFTAEGWFSVRLPMLLPKKEHGSAEYVRFFLESAMREYFREKKAVRYGKSVLIYRHVYDKRRPERQWRDHDNIEINMISDIIALYVMTDDAPSVCSHYYCSASGEGERTETYVVPHDQFPLWLSVERTMPDRGITLYETPKNYMSKQTVSIRPE